MVITALQNAGSSAFHLEFKYMMNQLPPTTMNPKKNSARPTIPPAIDHFCACPQSAAVLYARRPFTLAIINRMHVMHSAATTPT